MTLSRQQFLAGMLGLAACAVTAPVTAAASNARRPGTKAPLAIAMWDFSWLERRWPGAGYEDWDRALDGLAERGYDAVRIDPYPHLLAVDPVRTWTLEPAWTTNDWGSPGLVDVVVLPNLVSFIGKCRARGIKVALSTWLREDTSGVRRRITGKSHIDGWLRTLELLKSAGLLEAILYVDLCNEWPLDVWVPWFEPGRNSGDWYQPASLAYMRDAIETIRRAYPALPLLFSFCNENSEAYLDHDLGFFDLFEHHLWMSQQNDNEFYKEVDYNYERFDLKGYRNLALKAEPAYRARPEHWAGLLRTRVTALAAQAARVHKPLITTECWALVDYKDWPKLEWSWIKDLCKIGAETASDSGRWLGIATSNFCGPQFDGMWRDVRWHREMTAMIRSGPIAADLRSGRLWDRL